MSAKTIFQSIKREHGSSVSYQAVHKTLRNLRDQNVLEETDKKYRLNSSWLSNLNSFVSKVGARRSGKSSLDFGEIKNASSLTLPFDSYLDALYAILDNMDRDIAENKEPDVTVAHWCHSWPVTCVSKKEFEQLRRMMAFGEHYALVNSETALDRLLGDFWIDLGKNLKLGVPCATSCDLVVTRDKIVQIFLSPPVRKGLDDVFTESDHRKIDLAKFYSLVFGLKGNVSLIITRNKVLADQIRAETLEYFK
ncbi:MAG: hypothetical protein Q7S00_00645 [bacterium]|nr:hypothetical protein [bacterium]